MDKIPERIGIKSKVGQASCFLFLLKQQKSYCHLPRKDYEKPEPCLWLPFSHLKTHSWHSGRAAEAEALCLSARCCSLSCLLPGPCHSQHQSSCLPAKILSALVEMEGKAANDCHTQQQHWGSVGPTFWCALARGPPALLAAHRQRTELRQESARAFKPRTAWAARRVGALCNATAPRAWLCIPHCCLHNNLLKLQSIYLFKNNNTLSEFHKFNMKLIKRCK